MTSLESSAYVHHRQKRYHKKVITGCDVCRKRRVKCDEHRPQCNNCARLSRACEGFGYGHEAGGLHIVRRQSGRIDDCVSSIPALVVGGKVDPFNVFSVGPSPALHQKIFDHAIHCQWSFFAPSQANADLQVVRKDIMSNVIHNTVAYHTYLYAGACHVLFCGGHAVTHADLLRFKNNSLHAMRAAIQLEGPNLSEETLFSMVLLAAHGAADKLKRRPLGKVQSRKSLIFTLDAEYWCALETEWQHVNVFYDMMKQRGSTTLGSGPCWTATVLFDIFNAYMHLRRPQLDALVPMSVCFGLRTWQPDSVSLQRVQKTSQAFAKVCVLMSNTKLQQVIHGFTLVMADLDHFQRTGVPHIETVILTRSMCIRELLLLPDTIQSLKVESSVYEMCRISCLLCCQTWLYAYSGHNHTWMRNLPRRLVHMLQPVLDRAIAAGNHERLPDFYLWIVVMGLMLAYEDLDNSGNALSMELMTDRLSSLNVKLSPHSWSIIKYIVPRFLWHKGDCDVTAQEAWVVACQMYISDTEPAA